MEEQPDLCTNVGATNQAFLQCLRQAERTDVADAYELLIAKGYAE